MSEAPDPVTGLFPTSLADQIGCVQRELRLRERVYARLVQQGRMPRHVADREFQLMSAVLSTLRNAERQP